MMKLLSIIILYLTATTTNYTILLLLVVSRITSASSSSSSSSSSSNNNPHSINGRHSYSLTTFDTNGHLQQVEHAIRASSQGIPVLCCACPDDVSNDNDNDDDDDDGVVPVFVFVTPHAHVLPSPLIRDVGSSRITPICHGITASYSGSIGADGRVLVAEAQRLAVEHAYTYDEDIPIEQLVHQMALFYQRYTMKAGVRPFGCSLLIACYNQRVNVREMYALDPAGSVERIEGDDGVMGCIGRIRSAQLKTNNNSVLTTATNINTSNKEETIQKLISILKDDARDGDSKCDEKFMSFLVGTVTSDGGLKVEIVK